MRISVALTGFACLLPAASIPAKAADDRPIYYVMLQMLEDSFQDYEAALQTELRARLAAIDREHDERMAELERALEELEAERVTKEEQFNAEREALNRRIVAINEQIALRDGRLSEDRRLEDARVADYAGHPRVMELKDEVAEQLATVEAERARYLERIEALERARRRLSEEVSDYVAAGHPLAQEIESLSEEYQRFAEAERSRLKAEADAYATQYLAFENWLEGENEILEKSREVVRGAIERDREQRALHASYQSSVSALIEEYNSLVEAYNRNEGDASEQATRRRRLGELDGEIEREREALARAREAVIESTAAAEERDRHFQSIYQRHLEEKHEREARLARARAELNATRAAVESALESRRRKVDAQIVALEKDISLELGDARAALEKASQQVTSEYGRGHEGFDQAMTRVLEENEIGLLYTSDGAPRYDLSRPHTAAVYTAVERAVARRREIDAVVAALAVSTAGKHEQAGTPPAATALERQRAGIAEERQLLLEAHARYASDFQDRLTEIRQRRRAGDAKHRERRERLVDLYRARAELTANEFLTVQGALVAALGTGAGARSAPGETETLRATLRARAGAFQGETGDELLATDALLAHLRELAPAAPAASTAPQWVEAGARTVEEIRELAGAGKAALTYAWLERLRARGAFAELRRALQASAAVDDSDDWTRTLFVGGVMAHAAIIEQRLAGGETGIEVSILERSYRLAGDGSLVAAPAGAP
ncbi:MAG: hypothetical protein R3357_13320 [Burkholderiales bacterium]|nr:hypothetical protein [Burkholderiales bacterium]